MRRALAGDEDGTFQDDDGNTVTITTLDGVREMRYVPAGTETGVLFYQHGPLGDRPADLPSDLPFLPDLHAVVGTLRGSRFGAWNAPSETEMEDERERQSSRGWLAENRLVKILGWLGTSDLESATALERGRAALRAEAEEDGWREASDDRGLPFFLRAVTLEREGRRLVLLISPVGPRPTLFLFEPPADGAPRED